MKNQGSVVSGQKLTAQVREVLADLQEATKAEIAERLGVQTEADLERVGWAVEGLVKTGEATSIGLNEQGEPIPAFQPLKYRWVTRLVKARGAVQARLWRFACHRFQTSRPFTAAEAAGMAKCDRDYAKRYCRWLWNSGYLAIISRGRAGARLYQVVGGKERESAPAYNRRAEKRKSVGQAPPPAILPVGDQEEIPPSPPLAKGGAEEHRLEACATGTPAPLEAGGANAIMRAALEAAGVTGPRERLDAALEDFGRALVEVAGGIERAWEIIREMKGELLALEDKGHDEPGEPTEGHH